MSKILIIGKENAIRSQILEGYLKKSLGNLAQVYSCGIEPSGVDPQAIRAMAEDRVVIAGQTSDELKDFEDFSFDHIITFEEALADKGRQRFRNATLHLLSIPALDGFGGQERQEAMRHLRDSLRLKCSNFIDQHLS